jgi:predicted O-methyltransferase YrrM
MFTGYSALAMAEAVPADGRVVACELDPAVAAFAQEHLDATPAGALVEVRVGPALDTLGDLAEHGEVFDLVFVDADKAGYTAYVDVVLERGLLAPGGLLCIDNTLLQGQPWLGVTEGPGREIADFNQRLAADPRVEQVLVPLRDGVTLARRVDAGVRA